MVQDSKQTFLHSPSRGIQREAWKTIIIDVCAENRCLFLKLFFFAITFVNFPTHTSTDVIRNT